MMMVQLRCSIVSTCGLPLHPLDRSIFPKDAYSTQTTLQGRRPTVPMEFIAPWEEGNAQWGGGSHTPLATASMRQWPAHINPNCP